MKIEPSVGMHRNPPPPRISHSRLAVTIRPFPSESSIIQHWWIHPSCSCWPRNLAWEVFFPASCHPRFLMRQCSVGQTLVQNSTGSLASYKQFRHTNLTHPQTFFQNQLLTCEEPSILQTVIRDMDLNPPALLPTARCRPIGAAFRRLWSIEQTLTSPKNATSRTLAAVVNPGKLSSPPSLCWNPHSLV